MDSKENGRSPALAKTSERNGSNMSYSEVRGWGALIVAANLVGYSPRRLQEVMRVAEDNGFYRLLADI